MRATESLVKNFKENTGEKEEIKISIPKYINKGVKDFSDFFGAKIEVKSSKSGSGKISIPFSSEEDFNRIKKLIESAK